MGCEGKKGGDKKRLAGKGKMGDEPKRKKGQIKGGEGGGDGGGSSSPCAKYSIQPFQGTRKTFS